MAALQDHEYLKLCAQLASYLSISLSSARRRVELLAVKSGVRDIEGKKSLAKGLIGEARLFGGRHGISHLWIR